MMATALGLLALAVVAEVGTQPPGAIELPPYFDRAITRADLEGRSLRDLELMRDVLLYRMGEPVLKGWLSYYLPAAPGFPRTAARGANVATPVDRQNADYLAAYEKALPGVVLEQELDAILARHRYAGAPRWGELQFRAFSSDGKSVLLTSKTTAMLVEVATGRPLAQWKPGASPPAGVTFFDQAGSKVPSEPLEKGRAAEVVAKLTRHGRWRRNLALSLDGRRLLATAAEADDPRTGESIDVDPNLVVVDVGSGKTILRVATEGICSSFLPDSRRLIIAEAGVVTAWDLDSSKVLWHVPLVASAGYPGAPECLRLVPSPVGKVAYLDGVLIDVDTGATLKTLPIGVVPTRVVFSPDGGRIFVAGAAEGGSKSRRTSPSIWDVASGAELTKLGATNDLGWLDAAVAWSPDGRSVLLLNGRGPMIFDVASGRRIPAFAGHERWRSLDEEVEAWLLGRRLGREIPALREVDF